MKDDLNLLDLIKNSNKGNVDLLSKMYVYLPEEAFKTDSNGNIIKNNYKCSQIMSIVKYSESKINVSFVDLPKKYKGEKIDVIDSDEYKWHFKNMNPITLARYKGSKNWKEFN